MYTYLLNSKNKIQVKKGNEAMYICYYVILRSEVKNSGSYSDFKYLFFLLYV